MPIGVPPSNQVSSLGLTWLICVNSSAGPPSAMMPTIGSSTRATTIMMPWTTSVHDTARKPPTRVYSTVIAAMSVMPT